MTLLQNVKDAVKLLDYTSVPLTTENNLRAWQTIRAHLTSQEAEIARLREDRDSHQRVAIKAESRLAAANAMLRHCTTFMAIRHSVIYDDIQSHLQGAGDEARD